MAYKDWRKTSYPDSMHSITVKPEAEPCKQRYYPRNPAIQAIINEEVDKMLTDKVIEPSRSPWSSPIVLVKKPSGKYRFRSLLFKGYSTDFGKPGTSAPLI